MAIATSKTTAIGSGTWVVDPQHTTLEFRVRHIGLARVSGTFDRFDGVLVVDDEGHVEASAVIDASSLSTRVAARDAHLRSADFFDVEHHPRSRSRPRASSTAPKGRVRIAGDLTIRGDPDAASAPCLMRVDANVIWGWCSTSKKSAERRCASRAATRVDSDDASITPGRLHVTLVVDDEHAVEAVEGPAHAGQADVPDPELERRVLGIDDPGPGTDRGRLGSGDGHGGAPSKSLEDSSITMA
jgi:hypothetical protein